MNTPAFRSGEALGDGWRNFKANLWLMIGAFVFFMVINNASSILVAASDGGPGVVHAALYVAGYVVGMFGTLGYTCLALRVVDGEEAAIEDLFSQGRCLARGVLATIVYTGIVIGGCILLSELLAHGWGVRTDGDRRRRMGLAIDLHPGTHREAPWGYR